tara:strand:- start:2441 stop:5647 length:3207 start_codon:yes stop_codon:yes gene_type:complete
MGDFNYNYSGPRLSPVDISSYDEAGYQNLGAFFSDFTGTILDTSKSLVGGVMDENLLALTVTKALSEKQNFGDDKTYNPYNDMNLLGYQDQMGYFAHSRSKEQTQILIQDMKDTQQNYQNMPAYIVGRILGGLTDPSSLLLFTKMGRGLMTGSRLAVSAKLGGTMAIEEQFKRGVAPQRTLTESTLITGAGFVLPYVFGGINSPYAKKAFTKFDKEADILDDLDDAVNTVFIDRSVGAKNINRVYTEEELSKLDEIVSTGLGVFGEKGPFTPVLRTLKSSSIEAKEAMENLLEIPLLQNKNLKEIPTAQSIERNVNRKKYNVFQAEEEIENLYRDYLKRLGKKVPIMGTRVGLNRVKTESTWGSEDILSFKDFKTAVWKKRIGEQDPLNWLLVREIPEVAKAVEVSQKYIYKMGEEYDALGIPLMYMERQIQVIKSQIKTSTGKNKKGLEIQLKKLEEKFEYMKTNGSLAKDYVNRVWLRDQITARFEEFKLLVKPMIRNNPANAKMTDEAIDELIESVKQAQPFVRFDKTKSTNPISVSRNFRTRELRLNAEDEVILAEKGFVETDMFILQRLYFNAVAPDIELTKVFGDPMMSGYKWSNNTGLKQGLKQIKEEYDVKITKAKGNKKKKLLKERDEVLDDLEAARDLIRGTYGLPDDPQRAFSRGVRTAKLYNSMTMLTGFMAAVPDVARILMTSGINRGFRNSWDLFTNAMSTEIIKLSKQQAYLSGEALDMVLGSRAMSMYDLENSFGVFNKFEKGASSMANVYFTYVNAMNPWNTMMKSWASAVNGTRIIEESGKWINGTITKMQKAKLLNAGIDESSARKIYQQYQKHGLGESANKADWKYTKIANTELWDDAEKVTADIFHNALGKDINITIVTPGKGDVPLWFNTEMGGVVVQFKKFAMAATQRMLLRGMQERDLSFLSGSLMLMGAGAMVDAIRTQAFDRSYSKKPFGEKLINAFDRSGLGGIYSDINNVVERMGNNKIGLRPLVGAGKPYSSYTTKNVMSGFGLLGPSSSQFANITDIMFDWGKGTHNHYTAKNVRRLIPFQNVWYLDSLFDNVEKGLR